MHSTLLNKPRSERGRETLNRILSAAAQMFCEKGYHGASISDITKAAGVAAGTVYIYFESKYNLYKFLLLHCSHMIRKHLNQATKDCKDRREVEEVGLREWLKFVQKNPYMYHIIWESLYVDKKLFVEYYTTFSKSYIRGIDAAKKQGEIRAEISSDVLAWTLMGATNFLGLHWGLFIDDPAENQDVVESFMQILSGGIFAQSESKKENRPYLPIRIEVEFDDADDAEKILSELEIVQT